MQHTHQVGSSRLAHSIVGKPFRLIAADGLELAAVSFEPAGSALGTVIIHGATAVRARYYRHFAGFLASRGLRVISYDYRGVGASRPRSLRRCVANMTDWAKLDAAAAHAFVQRRFGSGPMAIVGHSFGGQLMGLAEEPHAAVGAVLVNAQFGYFRHWKRTDWLRLSLTWHALVPALSMSLGYLPGRIGIGEDLPRGVAMEWAKWCRSPGYFMDHHPDARTRFARFETPVLAYRCSDDQFAPPRAVAALLAQLSSAPVTLRALEPAQFEGEPLGHFGFFRPQFANTLWTEAADFLEQALRGSLGRGKTPAQSWLRS
ncbi:MAG: alpha/beta hydrolase superfamily protein [Myxococcaceae bacterium]|nr:alpha/beta hydrolase superfamily protein [Myxococcaceae bacterium]